MSHTINFCGASGRSYRFEAAADRDCGWMSLAGVVIYTAEDGRIIQVCEQAGRIEDMTAFWKYREAQRYGASQAFVRPQPDPAERARETQDLIAGLSPLCASPPAGPRLVSSNDHDVLACAA